MTRYRIAGLDISLSATGLARVDGTTATIKPPAHLKDYERHANVADRTVRDLVAQAPHLVVIEDYAPHSIGITSTIRSAEIGGIIRTELTRARIPFTSIKPNVLKRWATGYGNASDTRMIERAFELGAELTSRRADDEADAYLLRAAGYEVLEGELVSAHPDALNAVAWPLRPHAAAAPP